MTTLFAFDPGANAVKACAPHGQLVVPSHIALNGTAHAHGVVGLRSRKRPATITLGASEFFVGPGAYDFGRPVENLDFERLTGSPEMRALLAHTAGQLLAPAWPEAVTLVVGLPMAAMMGEHAPDTLKRVKAFFGGTHHWLADGVARTLTVQQVLVTAQPVGALFEYLLQDDGTLNPQRRADYAQEITVINVGMSTVDVLTARQGQMVERLTGGDTLGVQDMLADQSRASGYTLAELDEQARAGKLALDERLAVWERRVFGFVDKVLGSAQRRLGRVIATGGGTYWLREALLRRYAARLYLAPDPVMATARGLYRLGLKHNGRGQ